MTIRIRKDGIIYRVAYGWVQNPSPPINGCRLFFRFWMSLLFVWPAAVVASIVVFLLGARLRPLNIRRFSDGDYRDTQFDADWIDVWPRVKGVPIVPAMILVPLILIAAGLAFPAFRVFELFAILFVAVLAVAIVIASTIAYFFIETEAGVACRCWFAAKKAKVCPLVDIVGDEPLPPSPAEEPKEELKESRSSEHDVPPVLGQTVEEQQETRRVRATKSKRRRTKKIVGGRLRRGPTRRKGNRQG